MNLPMEKEMSDKPVTTEPPEFADWPERGGKFKFDRKASIERGGSLKIGLP